MFVQSKTSINWFQPKHQSQKQKKNKKRANFYLGKLTKQNKTTKSACCAHMLALRYETRIISSLYRTHLCSGNFQMHKYRHAAILNVHAQQFHTAQISNNGNNDKVEKAFSTGIDSRVQMCLRCLCVCLSVSVWLCVCLCAFVGICVCMYDYHIAVAYWVIGSCDCVCMLLTDPCTMTASRCRRGR